MPNNIISEETANHQKQNSSEDTNIIEQPQKKKGSVRRKRRKSKDIPIKIKIERLYKIFGKKPHEALEKLKKEYVSKDDFLNATGHTVGLYNINLTIPANKITVIMGLSGSGKSTLVRHINRLLMPTDGSIIIDGQDVLSLNKNELISLRREKISMVFQKFALFPHMSVFENVAFGLNMRKDPKKKIEEQVEKWLSYTDLLSYKNKKPHHLSGGMQQRLGLARALCTDTDIILMDEAFSALDPIIRNNMQNILIEIQKELQKTIVFITHDLDEALKLGDQIIILRDGRINQIGSPEKIVLKPRNEYVASFLANVNKLQIMKAKHVMVDPNMIANIDTSLTELVEELNNQDEEVINDFICIVEPETEQFLGILKSQDILNIPNEDLETQTVSEFMIQTPTVNEDDFLSKILHTCIQNLVDIAVLDNQGKFSGIISRGELAQVIYNNEAIDDSAPTNY